MRERSHGLRRPGFTTIAADPRLLQIRRATLCEGGTVREARTLPAMVSDGLWQTRAGTNGFKTCWPAGMERIRRPWRD